MHILKYVNFKNIYKVYVLYVQYILDIFLKHIPVYKNTHTQYTHVNSKRYQMNQKTNVRLEIYMHCIGKINY